MGNLNHSRRQFIQKSAYLSGGLVVGTSLLYSCGGNKETVPMMSSVVPSKPEDIKISLAQWSLNKEIKGGELDNLEFAQKAKSLGFDGIEYVNQFFSDKANDKNYLKEMNQRAADAGVKQLLIMIDQEGGLAQIDTTDLSQAIENHKKWVEAAKTLGCHSIRVNAYGKGSKEDVAKAAVEGLGGLATFAKDFDINVIVENHGGYSSDGKWLSGVMAEIDMPNCGTLPDFGNFCISKNKDGSCKEEYDKYQGVKELMPYAKAVSAKSFEFDDDGYDTEIDYNKMMKIVLDSGYKGYVGIEYEGARMKAEEGIIATKELIEKVLAKMS